MHSLGRHLLLELYDCSSEILNNLETVKAALVEAAKRAEATIVDVLFHEFNPFGISGVVVIAESHLSIHTWPEYRYAAVGYALPEDRTKVGVIMEYHDRVDRRTAEDAVRAMLREALAVRGERIRDLQVVAVEHRVGRVGCALAAVALLSEDDLL